jgi:hypothetical protein
MAKDEREEEREFLEGLKARSGRDLAQWMAAIAAQGFGDKNEIIDWLRGQGLPFARASWLERIHRNGGKPIHGPVHGPAQGPADGPTEADTPAAVVASVAHDDARAAAPRPLPRPRPAEPAAQEPQQAAGSTGNAAGDMERLLATAKGYRPLYHLLEARIRQAIPGAAFAARGRYVSVGAPNEFAAVTLHATEIRLGLPLGERPFDGDLQKAKLRGPGPAITHMVVLTDARQVNDALMALIDAANSNVNSA